MQEVFDRFKSALADRYRIESELGSGGMATVYLAHDLKHDRQVALKVLRPELAAVLGRERFFREITITAKLEHPHILTLIDSGEADGLFYYVMPYVTGESLREKLRREKQLAIDEALEITEAMASALEYAHQHGVIHRDIKPENILLHEGEAMVADFGIALALKAAAGDRLTETGLSLGTPEYMSPEQGTGEQQLDTRSDIYSLAAVLYEMLAGEPPHSGATSQSVIAKLLTEKPTQLRVVRDTVPEHVDAAVMKALAKVPVDRFPSARRFVDALSKPGLVGAEEEHPERSRPWYQSPITTVVAAVGLIAAAASLWLAFLAEDRGLVHNRVVVAPFENRTGDSSLNAIGTIAADWIANGLAQLENVEVVPALDAVRRLEAGSVGSVSRVPEQVLARETKAGLLVAGSFYPRGEVLEFEAHLVDTEREALLVAVDPVRGAANDTMAAIAELRGRIAGAVAYQLDLDSGAVHYIQTPLTGPPLIEAYKTMLAGMAKQDRVDFLGAEIDYRHAIALDSTFISPYFGLYWQLLNQSKWTEIDSLFQVLDRRSSDLNRVQRLNLEHLKATHAGNRDLALSAVRQLGEIYTGTYRFQAGWQAFNNNRPREAIEWWDRMGARPEDWPPFYWSFRAAAHHLLHDYPAELETARDGHERFGDVLFYLQLRALVGLGEAERVERMLDVGVQPRQSLGIAQELRVHGYPEAATRVADRLVKWYETDGPQTPESEHRQIQGEALLLIGRSEEAGALFRELAARHQADIHLRGLLGVAEAMSGNEPEARSIAEELASLQAPYLWGKHLAWSLRIEAVLGRQQRVVAQLRRAFAQGLLHNWVRNREGFHSIWLHSEPEFNALRDYEPFQELVRPKG